MKMNRLTTRGLQDLSGVSESLGPGFASRLLLLVEAAVQDYVSNPDLCGDDPEIFPSTSILTGDYYVLSASLHPEYPGYPDRQRVSVMCHCLGIEFAGSAPDDYLGLEIWLSYRPDGSELRVDRIDSSSI